MARRKRSSRKSNLRITNRPKKKYKGRGGFRVASLLTNAAIEELRRKFTKKEPEVVDIRDDDHEKEEEEDVEDDEDTQEMAVSLEDAMKKWEFEKTKFDEIFGKKKIAGEKNTNESKSAGPSGEGKKTKKDKVNGSAVSPVSRNIPCDLTKSKGTPIFRLLEGEDICKFCDHVCGRLSPLQEHIHRQHRFRCETCILEFGSYPSLRKHRKQVHAVKHRCDACEREFSSLGAYKNHIRGRPHRSVLNAQAKLYNKLIKLFNLNEAGGARLLNDGMFATIKEEPEEEKKAVRRVEVHDGEVLDFVKQQPILQSVKVEVPTAPGTPVTAPTTPVPVPACSLDTSPAAAAVASTASSLPSTSTTTADQPRTKPSKAEILRNGRLLAMEQFCQALTNATPDVLEEAYRMGFIDRPPAPVPTTTLTAEDLQNLADDYNDVIVLDPIPGPAAASEDDSCSTVSVASQSSSDDAMKEYVKALNSLVQCDVVLEEMDFTSI